MSDPPRLLCPQCGGQLRRTAGDACPNCGFFVGVARVQHRGALRYWRFLRTRRWIEVVTTLAWLAAVGFACWLIAFSPGRGFVVLTAVTAAGVVGLGKYLSFRRKKRE
jgi:hypothetical protein